MMMGSGKRGIIITSGQRILTERLYCHLVINHDSEWICLTLTTPNTRFLGLPSRLVHLFLCS